MMLMMKSSFVTLTALWLDLLSVKPVTNHELICDGDIRKSSAYKYIVAQIMKSNPCQKKEDQEQSREYIAEHVLYWLELIGCKCKEGPLGRKEMRQFYDQCVAPHLETILNELKRWPLCSFLVSLNFFFD